MMILKKHTQYAALFYAILLSIISLRILLIYAEIWPINGDEAQYFGWSQQLEWGYYSKPPMIAWLIGLSTYLLGDGPLGLRVFAPLCHALTAVILYLIGRALYDEKVAFWSGVTYLLLPGVTFSSLIISTDVPLILCWSLSLYCFINALKAEQLKWWFACGIAIGLALLSKYAAIFLIISMCLYGLFNQRDLFKKTGFYSALALAFLILTPNIIWNYTHHFSSFHAVAANADWSKQFFHPQEAIFFIASQAAIVGPILYIVFFRAFTSRVCLQDKRSQCLFFFTLPLLLIMIIEALLSRAHANWAAPSYVAAVVIMVVYLINTHRAYWLPIVLAVHVSILLSFFALPQVVNLLGLKLPVKMTVVNWSEVGQQIAQLQQVDQNAAWLMDDRMLLTQSTYFAHLPQKKVFKWNPEHALRDHYDLTTNLEEAPNKNFILLTYSAMPHDIVQHFKRVETLPSMKLVGLDKRSVIVYAFYLKHFLGYNAGNMTLAR